MVKLPPLIPGTGEDPEDSGPPTPPAGIVIVYVPDTKVCPVT
jgi:hypothetical protein